MLDTLYTFAKFQYECGNYSGAADYLYLHRGLVPVSDKVRQQFSWQWYIIFYWPLKHNNLLYMPPKGSVLLFIISYCFAFSYLQFKFRTAEFINVITQSDSSSKGLKAVVLWYQYPGIVMDHHYTYSIAVQFCEVQGGKVLCIIFSVFYTND